MERNRINTSYWDKEIREKKKKNISQGSDLVERQEFCTLFERGKGQTWDFIINIFEVGRPGFGEKDKRVLTTTFFFPLKKTSFYVFLINSYFIYKSTPLI